MSAGSKTPSAIAADWPPRVARLRGWGQTPETSVPDPDVAAGFIEHVGIATLFDSSPEIANLYHAHMGDPGAKTQNTWDSPSGRVYGWRWALGKKNAAFYGIVVKKRPTFVKWGLLPAVLRLFGDLRTPDELYDFGIISANAYRIAQILDASAQPISTGPLRTAAGFPKGKENRTAYGKALDELQNRLLITSEFPEHDGKGDKFHGLMANRHRDAVTEAESLTTVDALLAFLRAYLPAAAYTEPAVLCKQLKLPSSELQEAIDVLADTGEIDAVNIGLDTTVIWHV